MSATDDTLRAVGVRAVNAGILQAEFTRYAAVSRVPSGAFVELVVFVPAGLTPEILEAQIAAKALPPKPNGSGQDESIA